MLGEDWKGLLHGKDLLLVVFVHHDFLGKDLKVTKHFLVTFAAPVDHVIDGPATAMWQGNEEAAEAP